jgi:hypothetical protein
MSNFENELVHAFNDLGERKNVDAVAYRVKQAKYTGQWCDVLVDSPHDALYVAVENKSIKTGNREKLYFTQHFSEKEGMHQVEHFTQFLEKSGRTGFLGVEARYGRGKPKEAFLVPWHIVKSRFDNDKPGISLDRVKELVEAGIAVELERNAHKYRVPNTFL